MKTELNILMIAPSLSRNVAVLLAFPWLAATGVAQAPASPPIRDLGAPIAVSEAIFSTGTTVRGLPRGQVLVNDGRGRRVVMLDSAMRMTAVVLDTAMARSYGRQAGHLLRYLGDSSLFLITSPPTSLILDPSGRVARVGAGITEFSAIAGAVLLPARGIADVDGRGGLVYRAPESRTGIGGARAYAGADSAFLARWNVATHQTDTVAVLRRPISNTFVPPTRVGAQPTVKVIVDPLPFLDGYAVLSDGAVAIVRARDYHIDWINPDGTRTSSARLPYPWQKLTDDDKRRVADSAAVVQTGQAMIYYYRALISWVNQWNQPYPTDFAIPPGIVIPALQANLRLPSGYTLPPDYVYSTIPLPSLVATGPVPRVPTPADWQSLAAPILPLDQLADYWPPFLGEATRGDADGNVWVRTLTQGALGKVATYDVIGRTGIIDRVRLRENHTLVGFGPGGLVYVLVREDIVQHMAVLRR